jgi:hypothetical protein
MIGVRGIARKTPPLTSLVTEIRIEPIYQGAYFIFPLHLACQDNNKKKPEAALLFRFRAADSSASTKSLRKVQWS